MLAPSPFPAAETVFAPKGPVALVGNAPSARDEAAAIDACDCVVRFNNAFGFGASRGSRATHLVLVNHGGQMREWLDDPGFPSRPVVAGAGHILFPFAEKEAAEEGDGADWTAQARSKLAPLGVPVTVLPQGVRDEAAAILARAGADGAAPSTGFLAALFVLPLALAAGVPCTAHGFGFAGWNGHAWAAERAWFEAMAAKGRLHLSKPEA